MSKKVMPEEARKELARRELARRHLVDFSEYVAPWYHAAAHHRVVGEVLEQVETYIRTKGKNGIGRVLLFEPPRHGKSEQVSRHFPAWVLGRLPDTRVILASYGADLAVKHSRAAREIVMGEKYRAVFGELAGQTLTPGSTLTPGPSPYQGEGGQAPVLLSEDSRSVQAWDLASPHRGGLTAAGVGGAIVGMGANLFIVDDPFKSREEAESESVRERVWEWWVGSAYTRLEEGAAVVGMLTRWHPDDWAGRLLKSMVEGSGADEWVVVCLMGLWEPPAPPDGKGLDEYTLEALKDGVYVERQDALMRAPGAALWPAKYDREALERIRANIGEYEFSAQYQQAPYLRQGAMFRREWFTVIDLPPAGDEVVRRVRYWDKAGTAGGGARTAGPLLAATAGGLVIVEDVVAGQWSSYEREQVILRTAQLDKQRPGPDAVIWHEQEPGSGGKDSAQATNAMLAKNGFTAYFETVTGDKETRAGPWSSALQGGMVRLVRGAWNDRYIEEHVSFPKGKFKDQVDGSGRGFVKVNEGAEVRVRWL